MIAAFAPAKINLALHVTGRRGDGYHLLDSLVTFADVGDRLTFAPSETREMMVTGPFADGVPTGPENLIWRAADLLDPARGLEVRLEKALPHGAGIGGGSSDAAATIRALAGLWGAALPDPGAVLSLGADVPVCLHGRTARMSGIGEVLAPVPPLPPLWAVLVNPGRPVPTGACFAALARTENAGLEPCDWEETDGFLAWLARQRNDLENPARGLVPQIDAALAALKMTPGCRIARMSGSGATCFGLFEERDARAAREAILRPGWWAAAAPLLR